MKIFSPARFFQDLGATIKGAAKVALLSRKSQVKDVAADSGRIVILGNGPSLSDTMRDYPEELASSTLMAVNFAANAAEFYTLRPAYYVIIDPVFFTHGTNDNVDRLWHNLNHGVKWPMTLYVPTRMVKKMRSQLRNHDIEICGFNPIGAEGFKWFRRKVYGSGRAMPRPRNVLIAAIMVAIAAGWKEIYLTGADHSWTKTLSVSDENVVVSIQPHFYRDNEEEAARVASVYKNIRLHEILYSFYVAFKSYFDIREYAEEQGVKIVNATPGSFIDAFERGTLPRVECPMTEAVIDLSDDQSL